jgi:hypothetical protein
MTTILETGFVQGNKVWPRQEFTVEHTGDLTVGPEHYGQVVQYNLSSASYTLTLPAAASSFGACFDVVVSTAGPYNLTLTTATASQLTVSLNNAKVLDTAATSHVLYGPMKGSTVHLYCDGQLWYLSGGYKGSRAFTGNLNLATNGVANAIDGMGFYWTTDGANTLTLPNATSAVANFAFDVYVVSVGSGTDDVTIASGTNKINFSIVANDDHKAGANKSTVKVDPPAAGDHFRLICGEGSHWLLNGQVSGSDVDNVTST